VGGVNLDGLLQIAISTFQEPQLIATPSSVYEVLRILVKVVNRLTRELKNGCLPLRILYLPLHSLSD